MKILVTGGTGFLGKHLITKLDFCESVHCLVRKTSNISNIKLKNIEFYYGNINDITSLDKAMKGVDIVVHMAAIVFAKKNEDQYKINVQGTQNVVDLCKKNKIKKLVYISSVVVVYGKEYSNQGYIITKREAEDIVLKAKLNSIILRPSLIYGKGSRLKKIINIARFLPVIPLPNFILTKKLQQPVYVEDVIDSIIISIKSEKLKKNKPYFISGPKNPAVSEVINQTTIYPFKPIKIIIPLFFVKILVNIFGKIIPNFPLKKDHFSKQDKLYNFDISESVKDFGYNPLNISDAIKNKGK